MASLISRAARCPARVASRKFSSTSTLASLLNYPRTDVSTLTNGLTVASEGNLDKDSATATVGVWIDTGSRYETPETNGVAHFLEHMLFKGTPTRTRVALEKEVENMGGHLNAYTSREQTVFYSNVNKENVPQAIELLSDILQNSELSERAIEMERSVIMREMQEVDAEMEEHIFDRLHQTAYRDTMLGKTILGPKENVASISRADLQDYISTHYIAPRMVVAGAGAVDHQQLVDLADKHFGAVARTGPREAVKTPAYFTGSDIRIRYDSNPQAHIAYAFPTAGWTDPDNIPLMLIGQMLGSWDANSSGGEHSSSSLVANVASMDLGCLSLTAFNTQYSDTGLFGVYAVQDGTSGQNNLMHEITSHITTLCYNVDDVLLEEAKNHVKMTVLASLNSGSTHICEDIGRQMLTYGRRVHPSEILARIDAVDTAAVKACANRYFYDRDFALAAHGPILEMPDYNALRKKTYWLRY